MKRKTIIIIILIAAAAAAAGIFWFVTNQKEQETKHTSAEVVAWDVDIEPEEPAEGKQIMIPGYTSMVMNARDLSAQSQTHCHGDNVAPHGKKCKI